MNKIHKILLILIVLIFIGCTYVLINIEKDLMQQKPSICGNNVCEPDEEVSYCLDCNLSCESELCNSKINIICEGCSETQKELLPTLFEHQTIVYDCLSEYFGYYPPRMVYHKITNNVNSNPCDKTDGCYITGGIAERLVIRQGFIPGLREYNESDVKKEENVGFEVHELAHVFTYYAFGDCVPAWFSEGISIYTDSRLQCHSNRILSSQMDDNNFPLQYRRLNNGEVNLDEIAPYDEYYKVKHNAHVIGAMYFSALEQDYNCREACIADILYSLYQYRQNCTGTCFENAKNSYPYPINNSISINDLRIPVITNKIIKQKSEDVIGYNLTFLFDLLKIDI